MPGHIDDSGFKGDWFYVLNEWGIVVKSRLNNLFKFAEFFHKADIGSVNSFEGTAEAATETSQAGNIFFIGGCLFLGHEIPCYI